MLCPKNTSICIEKEFILTQAALSGIRILDFTRVLAGPSCTMLLADLGADVIKIENPHRGDDTRQWGPPWAGDAVDQQSAYFLSVNRNKRSLTLNLKQEKGIEIARQLALCSDILIENFKIDQMAGFGLGYDDLRKLNPRLVYCSITGYGQNGPYKDRPGYDYVVQAESGLMSITGPIDGAPHKVGVATADVIAGLFAANAIQAALRHAEKTGQGQHVDISLIETQLAALVNIGSNYLVSGTVPPRLGNLHANIVPYQNFRASDGEFILAVGNDRQYQALCKLIDRLDLFEDERFNTNPERVKNRELLVPILQEIFLHRSSADWVDDLLKLGIPTGLINNVAEALEDPHIQARGLIQETVLSNDAHLRFVGSPINLSETPPELRYPPPALGQHTEEILKEVLAFSDETIAEYRKTGVI
jgi:formyl-CoA transferase